MIEKYGNGSNVKKSIWWKDLNLTCVGTAASNWFENGLCRRSGEGDDTLFWEENWHGEGRFQDKFKELFFVSAEQSKKLAEMGVWVEDRWVWQFQ